MCLDHACCRSGAGDASGLGCFCGLWVALQWQIMVVAGRGAVLAMRWCALLAGRAPRRSAACAVCCAGRNVVLEQSYGVPQVINDGVSIARAIELEDAVENAGAQLIKEVAGKTNDTAGDGTTTATVLAREMIGLGLRQVSAGSNPVSLKRGVDATCAYLVRQLAARARAVSGDADIRAVASISAGNDDAVGAMVADAFARVGGDGVISIESGRALETSVEVQEGMALDRGYLSPQFINALERSAVELENVLVLVTDARLESAQDVVPILEAASRAARPLLLIADDVGAEALATLLVNRMRGVVQVAAIKAPGFGDRRKALLEDIAILTGAEFLAKDLGAKLDAVTVEQLGTVRRAVITSNKTTLVAGAGDAAALAARVAALRRELETTDSDYDAEKLQERIAKLAGGVAVIKVGAATEAELEDRKLRIEDAKNSTFAAMEEGIVPGGGAALLHLSELVDEFAASLPDPEERSGALIVGAALRAPARAIADNAGVEGEVIVQRVLGRSWETGYNAMDDRIEDMLAAGIIDPAKVTRSGLINACSIAGIMLTTQVCGGSEREGERGDCWGRGLSGWLGFVVGKRRGGAPVTGRRLFVAAMQLRNDRRRHGTGRSRRPNLLTCVPCVPPPCRP